MHLMSGNCQSHSNHHMSSVEASSLSCISDSLESIQSDDRILGSTVRTTVQNGIEYVSLRDFIMRLCKNNDKRATHTWDRLSQDWKEKLQSFCSRFQFPGRGQSEQPVITFSGAIKLAMILPGKYVKKYRYKFASIISRFLDGDLEMCSEIVKNRSVGKKRSYAQFLQQVEDSIHEGGHPFPNMPQINYIYATETPAFPGLIKIGRTINMKTRLSQLNTACAPLPHVVVAVAPTFNMSRDESAAHEFFSHASKEGEFFAITIEEVTNFFVQHIMARHQKELVEHMGCP